jgi:peroxygenase
MATTFDSTPSVIDQGLKPDTNVNARRDSGHARDAPIVSALDKAAATKQYPVPEDLDKIIRNPGCPRANEAPSAEHPFGSTDNRKDLLVMQQHIAFFDRDNDGTIWPWDTYVGFRAIGFNILFCIMAMFVIHGGFSYTSLDSWIPHPGLPIRVKNIHRCKHGSDSETYDTEGRYVPQKFEEIFSKYDRDNKGGLNLRDMWEMTSEMRNVFDFFGWFANKFEWGTLWLLCKNEQGVVTKEQVRRCFDGTLFYHMARDLKEKSEQRRGTKKHVKVKPYTVKVKSG